jgi:hypothetical protein
LISKIGNIDISDDMHFNKTSITYVMPLPLHEKLEYYERSCEACIITGDEQAFIQVLRYHGVTDVNLEKIAAYVGTRVEQVEFWMENRELPAVGVRKLIGQWLMALTREKFAGIAAEA